MTRRELGTVATGVALLACVLVIAASIGTVTIPIHVVLEAVLDGSDAGLAHVVWSVRLPRVAMSALVGACLGASGAATQAVFRNPLADPYLLGAGSGAGLGAIVGFELSGELPADLAAAGAVSPGSIVPLCAFAGGLGAVLLTAALARARARRTESLVLAGVVVGNMLAAITTFLLLREGERLRAVITWTLGNLALASWRQVGELAPYVVVSLLALMLVARPLDALQLGDETAETLGVRVVAIRRITLAAATLATSASIAYVGVIGFVGLVAPHVARRLIAPTHRALLPASALFGALLLVLADLGARTIVRPAELPVGIVLTLVGGPFVLLVLRSR
ncbi:FecCD family ABC transporter permease [Sandaracinus amylolyticus]|uniref:FecCD family ABC transporter permease n=1 Tax=Sandaracinus amylolyticus TaxID=927083 RepID=UPI00069F1553|nr:iron ABC transporter permease [Sandaracinus amylolyticus]